MSTHCYIGKVTESGSAEAIYCHWNGHPLSVGAILVENYGEWEIDKLLDLGSISELKENVEPPAGAEHTFNKPCPGVTVAYARDRGDALQEPIRAANVSELLYKIPSTQYIYLLKGEKWALHLDHDSRAIDLASITRL